MSCARMFSMPSMTRDALGYDIFGNAPELVCAKDQIELEAGIPRAGGDVECSVCHMLYKNHPPVQGALWATRTCKGLVKL